MGVLLRWNTTECYFCQEQKAVMQTLDRKFGFYSLIVGVFLLVLGLVGIIFPTLMSLATGIFVASLLFIGGIVWAIHTYRYSRRAVVDWLKPVLLLVVGGLMLFYPLSSVAMIGLLLAVYFLFDAMASFTLAQSVHPAKGWGWMTLNGVVSALLAVLLLVGWPTMSLWLVGIFVGISLLFDGAALVAIGWMLRKGERL